MSRPVPEGSAGFYFFGGFWVLGGFLGFLDPEGAVRCRKGLWEGSLSLSLSSLPLPLTPYLKSVRDGVAPSLSLSASLSLSLFLLLFKGEGNKAKVKQIELG